jgi:hypothetical protein
LDPVAGPGPELPVFVPAPELPEFPLTDEPLPVRLEVDLQLTLGLLDVFAVVVVVQVPGFAGGTGTPELDPA